MTAAIRIRIAPSPSGHLHIDWAPGLFEIVGLSGRDKCVARVKRAVEFIRAGVPA